MRGIHTCCPEPVSTVNVTQNVVEMDGTRAFWVEQYLTGAQYKASGCVSLSHVPYARSQLSLILNTAVQRQGIDFIVNNQVVSLTFVPQDDDKIHVRYFALTDGTSSVLADSTLVAGMMIGYGSVSDTPPTGWLFMDGATVHDAALAAYADLYAWLVANPSYMETHVAGVSFVLKKVDTPYYDGTTLVTGKTIIKY